MKSLFNDINAFLLLGLLFIFGYGKNDPAEVNEDNGYGALAE
jgi:hypothetical protein